MKVSFFESWVTFYPTQEDCNRHHWLPSTPYPLTIPIVNAMRNLHAMFTDRGLELPVPIPQEFGGGVERLVYPFQAGEVIHETIITDHAFRAWDAHFFNIKIKNEAA